MPPKLLTDSARRKNGKENAAAAAAKEKDAWAGKNERTSYIFKMSRAVNFEMPKIRGRNWNPNRPPYILINSDGEQQDSGRSGKEVRQPQKCGIRSRLTRC